MRKFLPAFTAGLLACSSFSPETGALEVPASTCTPVAASTSSYGSYGPSTGAATTCSDGGVRDGGADGGTNEVVPDAGVTGNLLIADQYNNRVIEITRQGDVVWSFGDGTSVPGAWSVVAPNDAERLPNGETLISGTGAPAGAEPSCPADGGGCPDNRVLIVNDKSGEIVWQYGADGGVGGSGPGQLSGPATAVLVPTSSGDHILITDQGNARVLEVDRSSKKVTWQFPPASPTSAQTLVAPNSVERLPSGNTLITDQGGDRVLEVSPAGDVVWQYPEVLDVAALDTPAFASRLPSGNTLITDSNNNRVLEVDKARPGNIVWSYRTASRTSAGNPVPTRAVRLQNGHTLVTETLDDQVIEIDGTPEHHVVYWHGRLGGAGSGPGELDQPYDAKVIGDYTGLTSPTL